VAPNQPGGFVAKRTTASTHRERGKKLKEAPSDVRTAEMTRKIEKKRRKENERDVASAAEGKLMLGKLSHPQGETVIDEDEARGGREEREANNRNAAATAKASVVASTSARRLRLPFVRQKRSWDCGLACALMILRELGLRKKETTGASKKGTRRPRRDEEEEEEEEVNISHSVRLRDLKAFLGTESVWSIEIALVLRAFGAKRVRFYTTQIGAKRQYKNERFYEKTFEMDAPRVKRAFAIAREKSSGIRVELLDESKGGMKDEWVEREVGEKSEKMLILLVDKRVLESGYNEDGANIERECQRYHDKIDDDDDDDDENAGFVGHYICVVGVKGDSFIIQDPARPEVLRVRKEVLHRARKSYGTDEDCIIVDRTNPDNRKQKERLDLATMCDTTRLVSKVSDDRNFEY
jgi:hypothetical protein